jgi:hypothetical protein
MEIPLPRSDPGFDTGSETCSDTGSGLAGRPHSAAPGPLGTLGVDKLRGAVEPRRPRSSSGASLWIREEEADDDGDQAGDKEGDDSSGLAEGEDDAEDGPDDDGGRDNDPADRRRAAEQRGPRRDILGGADAAAASGQRASDGPKALLVGSILLSLGMLLLEQPLLEALTRSPPAGAPARWLVLALQHPFRCPLALLLLALALRASPRPPPRRTGPEGGAGL